MLKRLAARLGVVALVATAVLFVPSPTPAQAATSDGITVGEFAYVYEDDAWLEHLATCPADSPAFVVLNIDNGTTNDVGHLDEIAQAILDCEDITVYGYVNTWDDDEPRTFNDTATDINRWVNPYNPERNVGGRFIDGIFLDQHPVDCGPTPGTDTGDDYDWMYHYSQVAEYVHTAFAFWSYPTPVVMSNVGTAVRGCHPGWGLYDVVSDYYVTFENTYDNLGSYPGGNIITGGVTGTTYEAGPDDTFVHIVHDAATMAEHETAIDTADARNAHYVAVTDDVLANPYDERSTYAAGAITYAGLHPMSLRMSYTNDFVVTAVGPPTILVIRQHRPNQCDNPGTPGTVERCAYPGRGVEQIWAAAQAECAGAGDWGDVDGGLGDPPDSAVVGCFRNMVNDDTGRDDQVCATANAYDWSDEEADDYVDDCQDADASGNYLKDATYSGYLRSVLGGDYDRTEELLVYLRDWENLLVSGHPAKCITLQTNQAYATPNYLCPS